MKRLAIIAGMLLACLSAAAAYYYWPVQAIPFEAQVTHLIVFKSARRLAVMSGERELVRYPISLGRQPRGDKVCRGDNKTPEGSYVLDFRNPDSCCFRSFHVSYPDAGDAAAATERGCDPGGDIMIHGMSNGLGWLGRFHRWSDWTHGCIALTDAEMAHLWATVAEGTPIEILP
ncbi:MAG TPA: L,D-transpeptidase family protein [bacterium]|nr:L,D-transpeptidase family protein [bacterium]